MQITLHTYFNDEIVTLDADQIEAAVRGDDNSWGPEHSGPSEFTEIFMKVGHVTSNGTSKAFVSETPEMILSIDPANP